MAPWSHHLGGVRIEGEHHAWHTTVAGSLTDPAEDHLMSTVHPIEHTDRGNAPTPSGGNALHTTPPLHQVSSREFDRTSNTNVGLLHGNAGSVRRTEHDDWASGAVAFLN